MSSNIQIYNEDSLQAMKAMQDKQFDLAIVDPPYGIGANKEKPHNGWIFWDKGQRNFSLADGELAYTSFNKALRVFEYSRAKSNQENKIHATQKPVDLYKWLLKNYTEPGSKILDTHLGSGSIAIACWDMGFDLTAYEIDKEYFDAACKRLENHKRQLTLW